MSAEFLASPAIAARHGFFTRRGGVSTGPYASLNCSLSGGDDVGFVTRNRALAAEALGVAAERLLGLHQVHGAAVVTVDTPWKQGGGARADAMVTAQRGMALGIITADCAPVLLHDKRAGVAGAAHAGWRGAAAGVIEATVAAMVALGADRAGISAAVGPCIAQASYEVGQDLVDAVPDGQEYLRPGARPGHWQFDLAGYCLARLLGAGVAGEALRVDTLADPERFFSHRRRTLGDGGPIGHQISVIVA